MRKGLNLKGARALVVGCGGVGCAIAASLAGAGVRTIALYDRHGASADSLAARLRTHYPAIEVRTGSNDPAGFDLVVNATPMGMNPGDPLPLDVSRLAPTTFVGEVVMRTEMTSFLPPRRLRAARSRSARTCCSSRSRPTWRSSATRPRPPRCCARWHG
jgi:shikimate dehydrogenase